MKKMALMFLLLQTTLLLAASAAPNPANFPVKVHVCLFALRDQHSVPADRGRDRRATGELTGFSLGVLALGDYSARISTKVHGPKNPNTYDIYKGYDFLMADGKSGRTR